MPKKRLWRARSSHPLIAKKLKAERQKYFLCLPKCRAAAMSCGEARARLASNVLGINYNSAARIN
jgi:hypothetical protein